MVSGAGGDANGGVNALLEAIKANPGKRVLELANLIGLSQRTIERYLKNNLSVQVEFRGAPKNGGYYCIDGGCEKDSGF